MCESGADLSVVRATWFSQNFSEDFLLDPVLSGGLIYLIGTFLLTMAFNVPLNDRLAKVAPESADGAEL